MAAREHDMEEEEENESCLVNDGIFLIADFIFVSFPILAIPKNPNPKFEKKRRRVWRYFGDGEEERVKEKGKGKGGYK